MGTEAGTNAAWLDRDYTNSERCEFHAQRIGKRMNCRFARAIRAGGGGAAIPAMLPTLARMAFLPLCLDAARSRPMAALVTAIGAITLVSYLAATFRRKVIAEGVETIDHGELLLALGCELEQGFGVARPMPTGELARWVATWQSDVTWTDSPRVVKFGAH